MGRRTLVIYDFAWYHLNFLIYEENFILFFISASPSSPPRGLGPALFNLAWLEAAWYFSEGGHVTTRNIQSKKCCAKCALLCYPSTEFESTFNVYWHGVGAAGLSCTELSYCWEFPFLRGPGRQGRNSIWYCVNGMPQKETLDSAAYTCMLSFSIVVSHLSFNFLCLLFLYSIYLGGAIATYIVFCIDPNILALTVLLLALLAIAQTKV
jgi:hypothetical protein